MSRLKLIRPFVAAAATLALLAAVLLAFTLSCALDGPGMSRMFARYSRVTVQAVGPEEYDALAEEITGYLSGGRDDLPSFQEHEIRHMADVRGLLSLAKSAAACLGGVVMLAAAFILWKDRGNLFCYLRASRRTAMTAALFAAALGAWGAIDFDSLFILFHKLSFTNDLWLLNPYEDLLLQLMPTDFFVAYAGRILVSWGLFLASWLVVAGTASHLQRRKK